MAKWTVPDIEQVGDNDTFSIVNSTNAKIRLSMDDKSGTVTVPGLSVTGGASVESGLTVNGAIGTFNKGLAVDGAVGTFNKGLTVDGAVGTFNKGLKVAGAEGHFSNGLRVDSDLQLRSAKLIIGHFYLSFPKDSYYLWMAPDGERLGVQQFFNYVPLRDHDLHAMFYVIQREFGLIALQSHMTQKYVSWKHKQFLVNAASISNFELFQPRFHDVTEKGDLVMTLRTGYGVVGLPPPQLVHILGSGIKVNDLGYYNASSGRDASSDWDKIVMIRV